MSQHQSGGAPEAASCPEIVNEIPAVINGEAEGPTQGLSFQTTGLDMGLWCGSETPNVCVWGALGA